MNVREAEVTRMIDAADGLSEKDKSAFFYDTAKAYSCREDAVGARVRETGARRRQETGDRGRAG